MGEKGCAESVEIGASGYIIVEVPRYLVRIFGRGVHKEGSFVHTLLPRETAPSEMPSRLILCSLSPCCSPFQMPEWSNSCRDPLMAPVFRCYPSLQRFAPAPCPKML